MFGDNYNNYDELSHSSDNYLGFSPQENLSNLGIPDNSLFKERGTLSFDNSPFPFLHQEQLEQISENQENLIKEEEKSNNTPEINSSSNNNEDEQNFKIGEPIINLKRNIEDIPILDEKNGNQRQNETKIFNIKSTAFISKENEQKNPEKVIECQKRKDYGQKYFKAKFCKFLTNLGNNIIHKSGLPSQFLNYKLSVPNHKSFTGNTKETDNYTFLFFTVQQIFCYYKNENCQNSRQKKNKNVIEEILTFIEKNWSEKYGSIKSFFSMNLESAYEIFYESKDFKEYAKDPKAIELDKEFKAQNKDSLLEKYGFIKMCKKFNKKEKKQ